MIQLGDPLPIVTGLSMKFRQPLLNRTETVGLRSIFWTAVTGPFYLFKKGALIEGAAMLVLGLWIGFADPDVLKIDADLLSDLDWGVWGLFVLLSPLLLAWSYRRRGWVEVPDA
jgi:hypothetical protein